ncbi:hypothetical protein OB955_07750 [Halobacteria archaeon AArc-m2/3/4]|uniref:DUF8215 domain-containing protein n=1 Tax=Natronoglomus mannanivorans TaxID=2979990 RepID=A0ABT2QCJ5_9EURY|nr:hypothetical protein [Halobacteria archaeon AArc-m2/3/4]
MRERDDGAPGRQTGPATTATRRSWYGHGTLTRVEKSPVNRYLHDVTYVFADVSIPSLPVLFVVMMTSVEAGFGAVPATMVGWATLVAVAAAIRGGWIQPLATDTPGWVAVTPSLVVLRLVYYNLLLFAVAYGSVALADLVGRPAASLGFAFAIALLATVLFPRVAESVYRRLSV